MGMSKLNQIVEIYRALGRAGESVAIIQNATLKNEKHVVGKISTIEKLVKEKQLSNPAVIVIGLVVKDQAFIHSEEFVSVLNHE